MSTMWVPWKQNPERFSLKGVKGLVWRPLLLIYAIFRAFPAGVFWGAVATVCVVVWLHGLLFHYVQTELLDNPVVNTEAMSFFGGQLTLEELQGAMRSAWGESCGWLAYPLYPLGHEFVRDIVALGGVIGFISIIPLFSIWWERKVSAHLQSRLGPMRVGGWHGWTQTLADGVKLIGKEDLVPKQGDGPLFRLAPYLAFVPSIMAFIALPFGTYWVFRNTDVGLLFILAMLGIEVIGVIIAGWASNNKWSVYGAMREACQMVSYEIPMGMALLIPIMAAGTLNLTAIGDQQADGWFSWFCFQNPFMFMTAIAYYVASLANCKRAPFDLAESESELVAGFHTEYSGFRWSMFFFAEYCAMFVVSGVAVILFFGAWHSPIPQQTVTDLCHTLRIEHHAIRTAIEGLLANGPLWFIVKSAMLIYIQMWIRWTLPRIRIDQVLYSCVQVLLPVMMVLLLGNTAWILAVDELGLVALDRTANLALGIIGLLIVGYVMWIAINGHLKRRRLVGYLAIDALPGS